MKCPNKSINVFCNIELDRFDKNAFQCRNCGQAFEYYNGKLFNMEELN